jgi:hypothetical protein
MSELVFRPPCLLVESLIMNQQNPNSANLLLLGGKNMAHGFTWFHPLSKNHRHWNYQHISMVENEKIRISKP